MDTGERFEAYLEHLAEGLRHADRHAGLRGYCTGLMLPIARKSVEPMATRLPLKSSSVVSCRYRTTPCDTMRPSVRAVRLEDPAPVAALVVEQPVGPGRVVRAAMDRRFARLRAHHRAARQLYQPLVQLLIAQLCRRKFLCCSAHGSLLALPSDIHQARQS